MENPETLMRSAAHDIRGYLASASLATDNLSAFEDDWVARNAARISLAIDQIMTICRDDLATYRTAISTTHHSAKRIKSLLEEISVLIRPRLEVSFHPLEISINVADDVSIICNSSDLFRIIYNLAINAVHAILARSGNRIDLEVIRADSNICFFVSDDGPGLPNETIDHFNLTMLGQPPQNKFSGYGLTSSISLAKSMGGTLHLLESSPTGSTFSLVLPDSLVR